MINSKTRIVTGVVRLSYAHIWEPYTFNDNDKGKYSCSILIDRNDRKTIDDIESAINAAIDEGIAKFGGKRPPRATLKLPLRKGFEERPDDDAYKDCYFLNCSSTNQPQIVDQHVQPILDQSQVYSGCYVRVSLSFYAFNRNGNKGVAVGLGNIQLVKDGEPLGGKHSAEDDFNDFDNTASDDDILG